MTEFEWSEEKAKLNIKKHGISFEEAKTVFSDFFACIFDDEFHSIEENRFYIIGYSQTNKLITISYTERNDRIRIISARISTKNERNNYEAAQKKY